MGPEPVPERWVGQRVALLTLAPDARMAQDTGELLAVTERGIVFRRRRNSGVGAGEEEVFHPWAVVYQIGPVVD